ncbi:MAG: alpha/beta hydrolase [Bacillota bacterium]
MERVSFINKKGQNISGLIFEDKNKALNTVVIVCHGFTGSKEGHGKAVEMAEFLLKNGYACLLFDFAGCGESGGKFEDISLSSHIEDLSRAVDFCLKKGFSRIVTLGRSFGGTTAICQAAADQRVGGVCTWAAPASLIDLFMGFTDEELPDAESSLVTLAGDDGIIFLKKSFFTDLSVHDVLKCSPLVSQRPLLVVQGTRDDVVPPEEAQAIFNSAGDPKELFYVEGADHQFSAHHTVVWNILLEWLNKHF